LLIDAALTAPGVPPNLTSSVNGTTVTLTWLVPTSLDPATSYVIEAGSSAGSTNIAVFDTLSAATSFTVTGVPAGTYFVRVRARNSAGTSAASNEVVVIVAGGPCAGSPNAPSGLTASVNGSSVSLSWTASGSGCAPTGYVVEAGSTPGASNLANVNTGSAATTFSAGGVPAGTYYVRVRAANGSGASGPSNETIVIVGTSASLTGRWVGVAPDGMIIEDAPGACDLELDLQLDLTQSGTTVTGTAITTTRRLSSTPGCRGGVDMWTLLNLTVGSGTISFSFQNQSGPGTIDFSGTFTATRMTGTLVTFGGRRGTFTVNRQ
jgi:predicted phage tail protein